MNVRRAPETLAIKLNQVQLRLLSNLNSFLMIKWQVARLENRDWHTREESQSILTSSNLNRMGHTHLGPQQQKGKLIRNGLRLG